MKTIVETSTNLSKYLLADDIAITFSADSIIVGNPVQFIIGDLNNGSAVVHESVTVPADWIGNKYTFDGAIWTVNPNWVEPKRSE